MSAYTEVVIFLFVGLAFVLGGLFTSWLIRPKRPNAEKLANYESGEVPVGEARGRVNTKFYVIALIFLLFEVEIVFLFPWATVFGNKEMIDATNGLWGWFSLTEMFVFVGILGLGLAYVWKKGHLDWPKPDAIKSDYKSPVPSNFYEEVNRKYTKI